MFSLFVKVLAVLDLVTALTTMTMDAMVKLRPLDENVLNLEVICKLTHFQVYASSVASACVLILIAYQRYRKVRKGDSFNKQMQYNYGAYNIL